MLQLKCPQCLGTMRMTKRLTFPDGGIKVVYECALCQRARIDSPDPGKVPTEAP